MTKYEEYVNEADFKYHLLRYLVDGIDENIGREVNLSQYNFFFNWIKDYDEKFSIPDIKSHFLAFIEGIKYQKSLKELPNEN